MGDRPPCHEASLVALPLIAVIVLGALTARGFAPEGPVVVPSEDAPPVVTALGPLEDLLAFAVSSDGASAAMASRSPGDPGRSSLHLVGPDGGEPETLELPGVARSLLFSPDGDVLYAILHKPRKKSPGVAVLFWVETQSLQTSKGLLLPPTATALTLWPEEGSLLVACTDEIRTFRLPDLTSGPLFYVQGENLSLAALGAGDLLIGKPEGLVLVSLDAPQGREGLEPRERVETAEAVTGLAAAPDGNAALARLSGGGVHRVRFRPLRIEEQGRTALAIAWLGRPSPAAFSASRARRAEETARAGSAVAPEDDAANQEEPRGAGPAAQSGAVTPETPREPPLAPTAPAEGKPPGPARAAEAEPAPPPDAAEDEPPAPAPAAPSPVEVAAPEEPAPPPSLPAGLGAARGRISGPEAAKVAAVVLFGPDNLLRTAMRVRPSAGGAWSAEGLEPGLYRILLAGEEGRVVASDPPYRTVRVESGRVTAVPDISASRVY